ncbi:hypothetical protein EUGRSUZ_B01071 [Eucalyptus grandis]|uniref:Uncharacterized protein n=2 Tax=Eucalyptus grandis TaxID=71139 RepID=A0ACC3LP35_EUCGR|nr:hypothetical protein EUGRSUZ_B01071 [Eucalyptus grandis]
MVKEEVEILKLLIGEAENSDATLSIIPIVRMGGVGKMALAQQLYNDANVSSCFERRAWVCVSDVFDVLNITKTILRSITELSCKDKDLNYLQVKLKDSLSVKKATNFERHIDLETIGKKIAEKCKVSPLAVKVLGGLLHNKWDLDEWEAILNNRMWDIPTGKNDGVLLFLNLSYVHLPSYLKRCFAYCVVFPKDYKIERDELVLLWIVEGFLDGQKRKENNLRLGRNYFDELVSKSFLQQSSVIASKFSMHGFLNDLAKSIAGGTCLNSGESQLVRNEDDASLVKTHYASFILSWSVTSKCLRASYRMKVLRNLILLHIESSGGSKFNISNKALYDLLIELNYLRVVSLCHCDIIEVLNCVGDLKHLQYLNFSYIDIKRLPNSIVALCKLQALILRGCQKLFMLSLGITKLVSLQFHDIRDTHSLNKMPLGIGNLKNLIVLPNFDVGIKKGLQLKESKNLSYLQGELVISELQKVQEARDAVDANLFGKQGLSNMFLHWGEDFGNLWNDKHEAQVLHYLRPCTDLENLTISYYGGAIFPSWLDGPSYCKLVSLCLRGCPNVISLPQLGKLPLLKKLCLNGLHAVRMIGSEFYGGKRPFSSLTTLKFEEMLGWND